MVDPADPPPRSEHEEADSSTEVERDDATATSDEATGVYQAEPPLERLGKYQIQEQIGRGGMGVVWKAFDPDLRRTVAIKVLGEHLAHSPTSRRRFQREARAAAAISHPHVLTIHSVEEDAGVPFLVMEYVRGQSLKEYVSDRGSLDPLEVIRLGGQIAQGLASAHAQGVIHRDVKPGNVMLDEGATSARLTDFGLARVTFDNVELTSHDQCVGTLTYMSPESLRGERIDARSDLFSLGCVLYLMLSGHSPFQGRSQGETLHKVLASTPPRLTDLNPTTPPVLSEIVERLLQKNPDDRYQSAAEVADVLSRLQQQLNQAPTDEIPGILATAPTTVVPTARTRIRSLWLAIGTFLVTAALVWELRPDPDLKPDAGVPPGEGGATVADDADSVAGDGAPVIKLDRIMVGPGPEADFTTIAEAVRHANPGAVIQVAGPGPYSESVDIAGPELNGLRLIADPRTVWRSSGTALTISDVDDVEIRGFDFDVDDESGRALYVTGATGQVVIDDCGFRHRLDRHKLSLALIANHPADTAAVTIRNSRFSSAEGPVMCLAAGSGDSTARIDCSHCVFTGPNTLVYVNDGCRSLVLSHNIFIGGHNAINLSLKAWEPDNHVEIVNNTFVGTTYWIGLMDSFRSESLPVGPTDSRVCNNLILGGLRMQGGDDQWAVALTAWTFAANWWEPDADTLADAGRRGQVASLHEDLEIPVRDAVDDENYLVPAAGSPLLTSGAGGDLPEYIGARTRPD